MIDTAEKKDLIIAAFGKHYSGKVIAHLSKYKIFNSEGLPFTVSQIKHIVCGNTENEEVETELLRESIKILKRRQKLQNRIKETNELLNS